MRQPAGDEEGKLTARAYWLKLANGHNETLRDRALIELESEPPIPDGMRHFYRWWCELDAGRRYGMNGAEPIGYMDIEAWTRLRQHELTPVEVSALLLIDDAVLRPGDRE